MKTKFTFGVALKIIFKYIQAPPAVLAERYVDRDRTLIYKWLRDAAFPSKKLIPDIIRFVMECSGEPVRGLIRMEMDRHMSESGLDTQLKNMLNEKSDFADYLEGVFSLMAAEKALEKRPKQAELTQFTKTQNQVEDPSPAETPEKPLQSQVPASDGHEIHIRLTSAAMTKIGFSLLAAMSGEILWAITAYALRWPYALEAAYNGAPVFPFFLRGFLILPIVFFAMMSLRKETPFIDVLPGLRKMVYIGSYALAGGIGGLLLAGPGLKNLAEGLLWAPVPQAALLVFIRALVLSFLPMLVLLTLLRFPRITAGTFLLLEFGPALLCVMVALPALLSGVPPAGRVWLGGFFPGFALSLLMFVSARIVFKEHTGIIKLTFPKIPQA